MPEGPSNEDVLRTATESRSVLSVRPRFHSAVRRPRREARTPEEARWLLHCMSQKVALLCRVYKSSPKPVHSRQRRKQSPTASAHWCIASAIRCRILSAKFIASSMPNLTVLRRTFSVLRLASGAPPGPMDSSHFAAASTTAVERVAAVRLKPRNTDARRHIDLLKDFARLRINPAQFALIRFPSAVPEFVAEPSNAGDEPIRLYGTQDCAGLRVDLVNLTIAILANPERAFRPRHAGGAAFRCRYRRDHTATVWVDLLDAIVRDLEQIPAVERGACMGGDVERSQDL